MRESQSEPLSLLRARLDDVDRKVLALLGERMRIVADVARVKHALGMRVRDHQRERQLLDARRELAKQEGLDPGSVEAIYRQILMASRDYQTEMGGAAKATVEAKRIAIIGGKGAMGGVMKRLFEDLGHQVLIADIGTELTPEEAASTADVVVVSVPIIETENVVRRIGPLVRQDALLMDVTSIKTPILRAMLETCKASVIGTHPMFGPRFNSFQGQRVVVCKGRGDQWHEWVIDNFKARGLTVTEASAEHHDRAMSLVQVLTHFQTQVMGLTLSRMGMPLAESQPFASAIFLMDLYIAGRHFVQPSQLFGPIEMLNPETPRVLSTFQAAAAEITQVLLSKDQQGFDNVFREVRGFLGEFIHEATEQSSYLIDRLVERSIG